MKGRSGRKRLPVELHILKNSYRPDRHGPRPAVPAMIGATALQPVVPALPPELVTGLGAAGLMFVSELWTAYDDWSAAHRAILREAALIVDSLTDYATRIAKTGALVKTTRGSVAPHPLLREQNRARTTFLALVNALHLEK